MKLTQIPSGVRVSATTESEQQVFSRSRIARGLKESRRGQASRQGRGGVHDVHREPAARFDLSPNDAEKPLTGRTTPARFFVTNVIF